MTPGFIQAKIRLVWRAQGGLEEDIVKRKWWNE